MLESAISKLNRFKEYEMPRYSKATILNKSENSWVTMNRKEICSICHMPEVYHKYSSLRLCPKYINQ